LTTENTFHFSDKDLKKVVSYYNNRHMSELFLTAFSILLYPFVKFSLVELGVSDLLSSCYALLIIVLAIFSAYYIRGKVEVLIKLKITKKNNIDLMSFNNFQVFHQENVEYKSYTFVNKKHYTHFLTFFASFVVMQFLKDFLIH